MDAIHKKTCPECASPIRLAAQVCPFCLSAQNQSQQRNRLVLAFVPLLIIWGIVFFLFTKLSQLPGHRWTDYASKVRITASKFHLEKKFVGRYAVLSGTIRNDSDVAWDDVQIEVQYLNKAGKMIDVTVDSPHEIEVAPHAEQKFEVRSEALHPDADYASHKVMIRFAQNRERFRMF